MNLNQWYRIRDAAVEVFGIESVRYYKMFNALSIENRYARTQNDEVAVFEIYINTNEYSMDVQLKVYMFNAKIMKSTC